MSSVIRSPSPSIAQAVGVSALCALLFMVAQPYGTPDPLGLGIGSSWTAVCYIFAVPVLLIQLTRQARIQLTILDWLLFAYLAAVLVTWPTGNDRQASAKAIVALLGQVGVFYAARLVLADSRLAGRLIATVLVVEIAAIQLMAIGSHVGHGLFNRLTEYASPHAWGGRPEISFLAAIQFALLLGIGWRSRPAAFRLAHFCLVSTIMVELVFLFSRLAWLAACGALAVWGLMTLRAVGPRWRALAFACVSLLAVAVFVRDPTLSRLAESMVGAGKVEATPGMRFTLWRRATRLIRDHPLAGVGLGNFQAAYVPYFDPKDPTDDNRRGIHAHNLFLHQAGEVGIPGGLVYAALWGLGLFAGWRAESGAFYAMVVVAVMGLGENMFLDAVFAPRARLHTISWLLLAMIVTEWSRRRVPRVNGQGAPA